VFDANRRHEDRHVKDDKKAFADNIEAWDKKLAAAHKARAKFHGATKADAEAALHSAMGGTPDDIANAFAEACWKAGDDYHGTPEGGNVRARNIQASPDCSTSSADCTNPS
jgi:hypothetical protein